MATKTIKTTKTIETVETIETVAADGAGEAGGTNKPTKESSYQRTMQGLIKRAMLDPDFRREFLTDPRGVYTSEAGKPLPEGFALRVLEDSANIRHIVLPYIEESEVEELSDDELDAIASGAFKGRWCGF